MEDLRCPSRLHGKAVGNTIEVKCDSTRCGAGRGVVVLHYFDSTTGTLVRTQQFREPKTLFSDKEK
jgi:hypothetical protein